MANLFFPYYDCGDIDRQKEIDHCLKMNIKNPGIEKLIVLVDDGSEIPFQDDRILRIDLDDRPSYAMWINLTKKLGLSGISLLCNSDIYFQSSMDVLEKVFDQPKTIMALSRWEVLGDDRKLHPNPQWSQDVWGMRCDEEIEVDLLKSLDFNLGVPRCDNKIGYIFNTRGWRVKNPCKQFKSYHVHETEMRTYSKRFDFRLLGGVAYIDPIDDVSEVSQLAFDIWGMDLSSVKSLALNKSMQKWIGQAKDAGEAVKPAKLESIDEQPFDQSKSALKYSSGMIVDPSVHISINDEVVAKEDIIGVTSIANARKQEVGGYIVSEVTSSEMLAAVKEGVLAAKVGYFFACYHYNGKFYFKNIFELQNYICIFGDKQFDLGDLTGEMMAIGAIPPVVLSVPVKLKSEMSSSEDDNFWQYPCATERQAFENHQNVSHGSHVDYQARVIHLYIAAPWATYVDKKSFNDDYLCKLASYISKYAVLATRGGFELKVHTVCQHIHWRRMLEKMEEIGITDVHLSHKNSESDAIQAEIGTNLNLHGWTLIAVNYEIEERSVGMERKPVHERNLLASFIGAHMKHYRDDSRIKLFEAAKGAGRDDIFVDLGQEWHFNKVVYEEQVLNRAIKKEDLDHHNERTFRYNSILSDSKFSLCPEGAGPNTLRFWESIAVGTIPVLFSDDLEVFHTSEQGRQLLDHCVVWEGGIDESLFAHLSAIEDEALVDKNEGLQLLYDAIKGKVCC